MSSGRLKPRVRLLPSPDGLLLPDIGLRVTHRLDRLFVTDWFKDESVSLPVSDRSLFPLVGFV